MSTWNTKVGGPVANQRRSQRVFVSIGIAVRNDGDSKQAFAEETQTLVVNAHGALIGLAAKVQKGQTLRIKNHATGEEQTCKAVYIGPILGEKAQVGVEFTTRSAEFWRIAFPPEDWNVAQQAPVISQK